MAWLQFPGGQDQKTEEMKQKKKLSQEQLKREMWRVLFSQASEEKKISVEYWQKEELRWAKPIRTHNSLNTYLCTGSQCTLDENQGIGCKLKDMALSVPGGLQHCFIPSFTAASLLVRKAGFQQGMCSS